MNYLLLIHGYTQNGEIIHKKIKKILGNDVLQKFKVLNPNGVYTNDPTFTSNLNFGWWNLESPEMYSQKQTYDKEFVEKSIKCILKSLEGVNSQDNLYVIAFSQGAVLTEIMLVNEIGRAHV